MHYFGVVEKIDIFAASTFSTITYMKKIFALFMMLSVMSVFAQDNASQIIPFNGLVTDMLGTPLKGVKVYVLAKSYAAKTDKEGKFGLSNVKPSDTLHVEYKKEKYDIPVNGKRSMKIILGDQMTPSAEENQELVDVGYGYVKRREVLQASNGIPGEVLRRSGKNTLLEALSGLVPGLNITSGGAFGQGSKATIRGIGTINASTEPLYLIDGVETSSLDFVNLNDVESVEVMKDASIYGAKGANGAILVHMKKY